MAEHFLDEGFHTIGFVTNPWLRADLGFDQGFEEYVLVPCFSFQRVGCDGRDLIERAKQSISAQEGRKVFLYLHFMDVHHPYGPTENVPPVFRPERGSYTYQDGLVPGLSADDLEFTEALLRIRASRPLPISFVVVSWPAPSNSTAFARNS